MFDDEYLYCNLLCIAKYLSFCTYNKISCLVMFNEVLLLLGLLIVLNNYIHSLIRIQVEQKKLAEDDS